MRGIRTHARWRHGSGRPAGVARPSGSGLAIELVARDEIVVTTDRTLDDPHLRVVAWQDGALRRVAIPKIGEQLYIPRSPVVLGLRATHARTPR